MANPIPEAIKIGTVGELLVQLGRSERAFLYFWVANRAAKSAS
jgi:hypothetical protein